MSTSTNTGDPGSIEFTALSTSNEVTSKAVEVEKVGESLGKVVADEEDDFFDRTPSPSAFACMCNRLWDYHGSYAGFQIEWFKDPLFFHLSSMYTLGSKRPLERSDVGNYKIEDSVSVCDPLFTNLWKRECQDYPPGKRSLARVIRKFFGMGTILVAILLYAVYAANTFAAPTITKALLQHFAGFAVLEKWRLYCIAAYALIVPALAMACREQAGIAIQKCGSRLRAALVPLIFRTALHLSPEARAANGGKVMNLFASDCNTLADMFMQFLPVVFSPLLMTAGLILLEQQLGSSLLKIFPVIGGTFPFLLLAMIGFGYFIRRKLALTDTRVQITKEIIAGVRIIKYYAWEDSFADKLKEIRAREVREMSGIYYSWILMEICMQSLPIAMPVAVFYGFAKSGKSLTYSVIFTSLSLFMTIMQPFISLTGLVTQIAAAKAAFGRIQSLLEDTQRTEYVTHDSVEKMGDVRIVMDNVTVSWLITPHEKAEVEQGKAVSDGAVPTDEPAAPTAPIASTASTASSAGGAGGADAAKVGADDAAKKGSDRGFQTIKNISMTVNKGELCAIVGPVGSGKSSIINAVLGEMYLDEGTITRSGSLAYHSQQPWIVNANIKENILLGEREDEGRLRDCIAAACLGPDLAILPSGLLTEIGEKGINLSGGQKARVSLARALYSNADVILMDDPLSAVDANVCDHLFHEAIKKFLCGSGKAVVLVTHQVHLLPECDKVVLLNADGTLRAACKYSELSARGIDVQELLGHASSSDVEAAAEAAGGAAQPDASAETDDATPAAPNAETSPKRPRAITPSKPRSNTARARSGSADLAKGGTLQDGNSAADKKPAAGSETKGGDKLVIDEDRETGLIGSDVYWFTIKAGNVFIFLLILIFSAGGKVAQVFSTRLLSQWGEANVISEYVFRAPLPWPQQSDYLTKYLLLGVASLCSVLLGRLGSVKHGLNTALNLHTRMVDHVLKAPTSWFDVTPVGRIINRFTGDISFADQGVSAIGAICIGLIIDIIINMVTIATLTQGTFMILAVPLGFAYVQVGNKFRRVKVELQRMINIDKSPVFVQIQQSLAGIPSLRAYEKIPQFTGKMNRCIDAFNGVSFLKWKAESWMIIRLEFLGSLTVGFVILISISSTLISDEYVGMALNFCYQTTSLATIAVYLVSNLESMLAGIQRIKMYTEGLPQEEPKGRGADDSRRVHGEQASLDANWKVTVAEPPADWPTAGKIEYIDVEMRYRDQDLVLNGVDFTINGKEKVGIAGRTGCGKSTLFVTLFRIENLAKGRIEIDGIDIATVPLKTLRSRLCIIPQDPVMFTDSLRRNVDPFDACTDAQIVDALDKVKLSQMLKDMPNGLQTQISEGGENLSVGQRQLICFARALLRSPKIVVLDEATASIDNDTDKMIQEMITEKLKDCTVLTIAHRLHTITSSDRIIVMNAGKVAEVGTPAALKAKEGGMFRQMWEQYEKAHSE